MDQNCVSMWGGEETKYFFDLSPEKILDAVETLGVRCTGRCIALNSMENRVYEVEIESNDDSASQYLIAKFYRPGRWSHAQIEDEHQFLFDLAEVEIPVICPRRDERGCSLFSQAGTGIRFAVFPKAGGRCLDELNDEQLMQVGRLIGRVHHVGCVRPANHRLKLTPLVFGRQNLQIILPQPAKNRGVGVEDSYLVPQELAPRFKTLVEEICDLVEPLFERASMQRIHGDCHFGNMVWGREGLNLVDFDDMVMGPPVQDLWLVLQGEHGIERRELLLEGYEQMTSFDRRTLRLVEPLRALRMINFSAWIARRWGDPAFKQAFPGFGTRSYWQEQYQHLLEQRELIIPCRIVK